MTKADVMKDRFVVNQENKKTRSTEMYLQTRYCSHLEWSSCRIWKKNFPKWEADCLFGCNRGDTYYSITAGSRQGSLAKPLSLLFLTPRLALSSHQLRTLVCWSGKLYCSVLTHQQICIRLIYYFNTWAMIWHDIVPLFSYIDFHINFDGMLSLQFSEVASTFLKVVF